MLIDKMKSCVKPEDEEQFRQHFIAFFIVLLVESNRKGSCMVDLFIEDVNNIEKMNWCKLEIETLVHSRLEWEKNKKSNFQGPILFLLPFYVDRVMVLAKENPKDVPVFKGWSDDSLKRREKDEDRVGGFGGGHVIESPTYNRVEKAGQSTKLNKPQKGEKVEDVVKVIKEKSSICEAAIKDLMESMKRIPKEEKMEP